jgi:hypothetical protein
VNFADVNLALFALLTARHRNPVDETPVELGNRNQPPVQPVIDPDDQGPPTHPALSMRDFMRPT